MELTQWMKHALIGWFISKRFWQQVEMVYTPRPLIIGCTRSNWFWPAAFLQGNFRRTSWWMFHLSLAPLFWTSHWTGTSGTLTTPSRVFFGCSLFVILCNVMFQMVEEGSILLRRMEICVAEAEKRSGKNAVSMQETFTVYLIETRWELFSLHQSVGLFFLI